MRRSLQRAFALGATLAALGPAAALAIPTPALGATGDPLPGFPYVPTPPPAPPMIPPPTGYLNGPCGVAVNSAGDFYVSDYYHQAVDLFNFAPLGYASQPLQNTSFFVAHTGPVDDPCGLALDGDGTLYVNNYHRNVVKFSPISLGSATVIDSGDPSDSGVNPTGVAVDTSTHNAYVDDRTYVTGYDSGGTQLTDGPDPLKLGENANPANPDPDYYGLAVSRFPATAGWVYVADAAANVVKAFNPAAVDKSTPALTIAGPTGGFTSLRDAAIAVDDVTGNVYVVDNLQPTYTEEPQAAVEVFNAAGNYLGVLKYEVVDALQPGLAVDNSGGANQGRVYVTSGNTTQAGVYAYASGVYLAGTQPGSALPPTAGLLVVTGGTGAGAVTSSLGGLDCASACSTQIRAGAAVALSATPDSGSSFEGWSGGACSGTGECTVTMDEAKSVSASFEATSQGGDEPSPPTQSASGSGSEQTQPADAGSGATHPPGRSGRPHRARRHHSVRHRHRRAHHRHRHRHRHRHAR